MKNWKLYSMGKVGPDDNDFSCQWPSTYVALSIKLVCAKHFEILLLFGCRNYNKHGNMTSSNGIPRVTHWDPQRDWAIIWEGPQNITRLNNVFSHYKLDSCRLILKRRLSYWQLQSLVIQYSPCIHTLRIYIYIYVYVLKNRCTYIYIYIHINLHIYIYTYILHTYIHIDWPPTLWGLDLVSKPTWQIVENTPSFSGIFRPWKRISPFFWSNFGWASQEMSPSRPQHGYFLGNMTVNWAWSIFNPKHGI